MRLCAYPLFKYTPTESLLADMKKKTLVLPEEMAC